MTLQAPPDARLEISLRASGRARVAGVDEVGRGPLAGPVVAAAVVLDLSCLPEGLNDSKKLRAARRAELCAVLRECAEIGIGAASVEEIDALNILQATFLAMRRAVAALARCPDHCLVDGNRVPAGLPCPAEPVIGGDALSCSIAAASIVAKMHRDGLMVDLAQHFPSYGWERNAGYGTAEHMLALKSHGVTPHHRRSFRPVHNMLYQEESTNP